MKQSKVVLPEGIVTASMTETASIVSGEYNDGVVVEIIHLETVNNLSNAVINGSQHGQVDSPLWVSDRVRKQVHILSWYLEWGMESLVGEIEEEWITGILFGFYQ